MQQFLLQWMTWFLLPPLFLRRLAMDAENFKANLRGLLEAKGLSQRELADRCGLGYHWVRRVCSRGLTREEDRNRDQLNAICKELGVSPIKRLWSPDLLASKGEAAWYGSKVEEILNATCSVENLSEFVDISEDSINEMVRMIDRLHSALKKDRELLAVRQKASVTEPETVATQNQPQVGVEYSAKLCRVLVSSRPEDEVLLRMTIDLIDAIFNDKKARRIVALLNDHAPERFGDWLAHFNDRNDFAKAIAVTLGSLNEDEVLEWLIATDPPMQFEHTRFGKWQEFRDLLLESPEAERDQNESLSTFGGNVAGGIKAKRIQHRSSLEAGTTNMDGEKP